MAAALASGAVALAAHYGFHPSPEVVALIGAASTIVLNLLARTKVSPMAGSFITAVNTQLAEPSPTGPAAVGGAAGGAAGAAAGGAVGAAVGSILGVITGAFKRSKP